MSYLEIKTIKGRKYRYERTSYRDGNIVKHKSKYLGAVKPLNVVSNSGRKPILKSRVLTENELNFIAVAIKNSRSFIKDRARIIKLSSEGNFVKQICQRLKFDNKKVGKIINTFNKDGLKIFVRKKSSGKPRSITKEQRAKIIEWLNTHPKKLKLYFNNWSQNKLSKFAKKNNIEVSPSQIARIIKQDEIRYKTKRSKMYSNDKNFLRDI
ncbi:helix-turn-helix domain-containing protein [Candidatus Pacearchaeota archaeon]|nr:hypothetical protein [uncultured archaeon]AQS34481.1 hypothetical protein [uncultured archaeon]MBS3081603.1 helix-turn-helix domain-containing protein [Candidatus Pacearchaeota archaeon]